MADAYKGLTIVIDGDTRPLSKALSASNAVIRDTEAQLRKMTKAAKIDPGNSKVAAIRMQLIGEEAQVATRKLELMKKAWAELADGNRFDMSTTLDAAAKAAERAKRKYNETVEALAKLKREMSLKLTNGNDAGAFVGLESLSSIKAKMKELGATSEQTATYVEMVAEYFSKLEHYKDLQTVNSVRHLRDNIVATEVEVKQLYKTLAQNSADEGLTRINNKFKLMNTSANNLERQMQRLDSALELDQGNMQAAVMKFENMQKQIRLAEEKASSLRTEIERLKKAGVDKVRDEFKDLTKAEERAKEFAAKYSQQLDSVNDKLSHHNAGDIKLTADQLEKSQEEAEKLTKKLERVNGVLKKISDVKALDELRTDLSEVTAKVASLNGQLQKTHGRFSKFAGAMQQVGWAMYSTVTPALTMFGYSAINAAETVDASYRNMRKTVQGTESDFEDLRQAAMEYSQTHFTSADQILEIEAIGGQLGIAVENLESFATTVSNLDIATDLDTETAAEELGQLSGILNDMTENDFDKYGDALVRLGNNAPTLESHISNVMLRIASMGTISGFTTPQLLALSTAVASTGQGAEAAGTAISKTMSNMESGINGAAEDLEKWTAVASKSSSQAGITADEFKRLWNSSPNEAFTAFIEGLRNIEKEGGSADSTLKELGINGVRQKQALLGLTQTIGSMNDYTTMAQDAWDGLSDAWGESGDAANEADKKAEGFSGSIQKLRNNFQVLGIEMGESFAPTINALNDFITAFTDWYRKLGDGAKQVINWAIMIGAVFGPATVAVNSVSKAVVGLTAGLRGTKSAWSIVSTGAGTFEASLTRTALSASSAAGVYGAMAAAAIVAIGLIIAEYKKWDKRQHGIERGAEKLHSAYREALTGMVGGYLDASGTIIDFDAAVRDCNSSLDDLIDEQNNLAESVRTTFEDMFADVGTLEYYKDSLQEVIDSGDKSPASLSKLQTAIGGINSACGTSYSVSTDAAEGYIIMADGAEVAADEIYDLVEAQERQMQAEAYKSAFEDTFAQYQKAIQDQAKAKAALDQAVENYNKTVADAASGKYGYGPGGTGSQEIQKAKSQVDQLTTAYEQSTIAVGELGKETRNYEEGMSVLNRSYGENASAAAEFMGQHKFFMDYMNENHNLDNFVSQLEAAGVSLETFGDLNDEELTNLFTNYDGTFTSLLSIISEFAAASGNESAQATAAWMDGWSETSINTVGAVSSMTGVSAGKLHEFAEACGYEGEQGMNDFISKLEQGSDEAGIPISEMMEIIALEMTNGDAEAAAELLGRSIPEGLATGISDSGEVTYNTENVAQDAIDAARNVLQTHSPSRVFREIGLNITQGLAQGISEGTMAITAIKVLAQGLVIAMRGAGQRSGAAYGQGLAGSLGSASGAASSVVSSVANTFKSGAAQAKAAGSSTSIGYAGGMLTMKAMATASAKVITNTAVQQMAQAKSKAQSAGRTTSAGYAAGILGGRGAASSAGRSVGSAATSKMARYGDAHSAGYSTATGFAAGIRSGIYLASNAGSALGNAAIKAAKAAVKQGSPSRVFMEIGYFVAEGFAIGIEGNASAASKASSIMASDAVSAAQSALNSEGVSMQAQVAADVAASYQQAQTANAIGTLVDRLEALETKIDAGPTYNLWMDNLKINDDLAIRSATESYVKELSRRAAMNRG